MTREHLLVLPQHLHIRFHYPLRGITMVVYAGIANVSTGALFMSGLVPGILLGLAMMAVVK